MRMLAFLVIAAALLLTPAAHAAEQKLPNILWLTTEDIGPQLGCYGDPNAVTPNLDKLAAKGVRYARAWSNAPVCAPARSTIILGVYPTSTGGEHMRSEVALPPVLQAYPTLLREAGYHCTNQTKTDYNYSGLEKIWDSGGQAPWKSRKPGQPFFAIFNDTGTHESKIRARPHQWVHDISKMRIPAYHPDTLEVRQDWAQYYDNITDMDARMGDILKRLDEAGETDNTIVFFYGDHGSGMPRSKRWPYNSGLHVPLIVYVPEKWKHLAPPQYQPGAVMQRLVSFVDLAPTVLSIAGRPAPAWMQGSAFMGAHVGPDPKYLHGFRGRMDERLDSVRSLTDGRYVYIRNYAPHRVYGQYLAYMFQTPTTQVWKRMFDEGKLNASQSIFWKTKPAEELYDLTQDRDEVNNLAGSPAHQAKLEELRAAHRDHVLKTRDVGLLTEAEFHRRAAAAQTTIYEMAQNPAKYPVEKVLDAAQLAAAHNPAAASQVVSMLSDSDSGVRYWGAVGLLVRGEPAVTAARDALRKSLADESPSVRIAAAEALGKFGDAADLTAALDALRPLVSPAENNIYVAVEALNTVAHLGDKSAPLHAHLRQMSIRDPNSPARAQSDYVQRLLENILGDYKAPAEKSEPKKAKAKKKAQ